ncbi:MAG: hypothetical protein LBU27_03855 [Candidatus Peribacteria bacterium]|jgi:hypothetical protein|nr:hypothetical protein [Candidatus Peribacteria bacterium]
MKKNLIILIMMAGFLFSACEKNYYEGDTVIVCSPNGENGGSSDVSFIVDGKIASEITVYQDFWLTLQPVRPMTRGYFKVWYHWAPEGILWGPTKAGVYLNIVPYYQKGQTEIFYAQYFDVEGKPLTTKRGLKIHYR